MRRVSPRLQRSYDAGRQAARDGLDRNANHYERRDHKSAWRDGFLDETVRIARDRRQG